MTEELPAHSEHSPSSSEGWTTCPDYINANRGLPDIQSWEAAEGTAAHWIRNECLMHGLDADGFIGHVQKVGKWEFEWTADDAMLLQPGIDHIRNYTGTLYGEHWVDLTEWLGLDSQGRRQGGTLDAGILLEDGRVVINDEKWGRGVPVYPERNKQVMLYALGFAREQGITDPETQFILEIDQPRHMGAGGQWRTTFAELLAFGEWIKERVAATHAPNPPRVASEKGCMWCRRKNAPGGCGTLDAFVMELLAQEFEDLDNQSITLPGVLTPERKATVLRHRDMIEEWLKAMHKDMLMAALAGEPSGGMKAVDGRKDADRWHDEKTVATPVIEGLFGAASFTRKLISPTQVSKKIDPDSFDWLIVEPLIKRGVRKPELVPEEDKRLAITSAAEFEDLDD